MTPGPASGLRPADLRFLLPRAPASASVEVAGAAAAQLSTALRRAGIDVVPPSQPLQPHVRITGGTRRGSTGETSDGRTVDLRLSRVPLPAGRGRGQVHRYLVLPGPEGPAMLALATPEVRRYLTTVWSRPATWRGRARNRLLASRGGWLAAGLTVTGPALDCPYPIARALRALPPLDVTGWLLVLREGDDLQRVVALVFGGRGVPEVVVKFSRRPGAPARGEHETAVLEHLRRRAPGLAERATAILHRGELDGSELTVERAAPGTVLSTLLHGRSGASRAAVNGLVDWSTALSRDTLHDDARSRDAWLEAALEPYGATALAARLSRVPVCVAHQDLGSWNVVVSGDDFVVVDWESASTAAPPLADTAYLLTDLLVQEHGPVPDGERTAWAAQLWAGALPESAVLQRGLDVAAGSLGLSGDQAAALVTASWLHHGLSRSRRAHLMGTDPPGGGYLGELAGRWMGDARLGVDWAGLSLPVTAPAY